MEIGEKITRGGFITQRKFVVGQSLLELERRLGFEKGRLESGAYIAVLGDGQSMPIAADFELRGYSQVADHRWSNSATAGLNMGALKNMAMQAWEASGPNSLVKIIAIKGHDDNIPLNQQYPPGSGVPQWKLVKWLSFSVVAVIKNYPEGRWSG